MTSDIARLVEVDRERSLLAHIGAVLGWDQETYMPPAAIEERAEQLALLEGLAHERATAPEIGEILARLGSTTENPMGRSDLEPTERAYLRVMRREYDRETKLPADLVTEMARAVSRSQAAWAEARERNDFASFAPHLDRMVELNRRMAACLEPAKKPYDVLLDLFEPGSDEASIAAVFSSLRADLVKLLDRIRGCPQVDDAALHRKCPAERQAEISSWLMDILAFDRSRGRLDIAAHPFTESLGRADVRITTRYLEDFLPSSIFSTIHETGHALYEMGIDPDPAFASTRLAEASSMAIHESQSRMWENLVGRSIGFWKGKYGRLTELSGGSLDGLGLEDFHRAINRVEPSFIRTEADEVTYGLHVILRFELEAELISGRLAVKDLPAAWNAKMRELLGIVPPTDRQGCLQDIHWSMGSFGYFPSYSLGNLYASQLWASMSSQIGDLPGHIEAGNHGVVLNWLRSNVHASGAVYLPGELIKRATGEALESRHFVAYLKRKYAEIYRF
ncbi:MAG TPA: carboxypeptidase M32 [Rectinemataceae bacterium]|nr:carboxypeptidase M32 [Rectinemataceae bacterium]